MVTGLATSGEDEVVADLVAAAKTVVGVNSRPRAVEEQVAGEGRLARLRLEPHRALQLPHAELAPHVAGDDCEARLFAAEGATVVMTDVLDAQASEVARSIGPAASYHRLDVTEEAGWKHIADDIRSRHGQQVRGIT